MARSLRIARENGVYHVINRGNYRQEWFIDDGAHYAFEKCLFEACEKCGWIREGFCVMTNHFHLVIRTPRGNLVYGMKWLQSTFANRYHSFRKVHGKRFQGRYKSLIVEEGTCLGALLHDGVLNSVRGGICDVAGLRDYRRSSYWYLRRPASRPAFLDPTRGLTAAGPLLDTPKGHHSYEAYLEWLAEDATARQEMAFDKMCRGWALGSKNFKRDLLQSEGLLKDGTFEGLRMEVKDLAEANELIWENVLSKGPREAHRSKEDGVKEKKSADWKVRIAAQLKRPSSAPNTWIALKLNMGAPQLVGVCVNRLQREREEETKVNKRKRTSQYTE